MKAFGESNCGSACPIADLKSKKAIIFCGANQYYKQISHKKEQMF
jgi:hypothetical protein